MQVSGTLTCISVGSKLAGSLGRSGVSLHDSFKYLVLFLLLLAQLFVLLLLLSFAIGLRVFVESLMGWLPTTDYRAVEFLIRSICI